MNNEEKILEMLTQMQGDLAGVKGDLASVKGDLANLKDNLAHVKARLDYDVDKKLDAINEGTDTIQETMVSKSRVEQLEDDVIVLKTAVKMLTQEVAELKKAQ